MTPLSLETVSNKAWLPGGPWKTELPGVEREGRVCLHFSVQSGCMWHSPDLPQLPCSLVEEESSSAQEKAVERGNCYRFYCLFFADVLLGTLPLV